MTARSSRAAALIAEARLIHPKSFYRELDRLLGHIGTGTSDPSWFRWFTERVAEQFGSALHLVDATLYVESAGQFFADVGTGSSHAPSAGAGDPVTALVLAHEVFLFDTSVLERLGGTGLYGSQEFAAVFVDSRPRRIFAFRLGPGWDRAEVDLALNTLQNAVNHHLQLVRLTSAIQQASEIQRSLLPVAPPRFPGFDIAARSAPAASVGGDFYDFLPLGDDLLGIAVGDASGHGLGAALLARDVVTGLRMGVEKDLKIASVIERLNGVIQRSGLSTRFASLFFGELEANGSLFYVNAGHPPPWIFGPRGVRRLEVGGAILGPLEGARFKRGFAQLDEGDTLVILTDGLLERKNALGDMFDDRRVEHIVESLTGSTSGRILDTIFQSVETYGGAAPWSDDTTAVVVVRGVAPAHAKPAGATALIEAARESDAVAL